MSKRWTKIEEERFKRDWLRGMSIKHLVYHYGRQERALYYKVDRMGLPRRYQGHRSKGKRFGLYLNNDLFSKLQRRSNENGTSKAIYVRNLIQRDLGL